MKRIFAFLFLIFMINSFQASAQLVRLYVLNRGGNNIVATPYGGSSNDLEVKFNQNLLAAYDFVVDPSMPKLYWTNTISHRIVQSEIGLGGSGQSIDSDVSVPVDMEIDGAHNKLYWADNLRQKVFRSNLDGTQQETVTSDSVPDLSAIALFPAQNKIFYAGSDSRTIWVSNLDGSSASVFLDKDIVTPVRLLIDTIQQKLYWSDDAQNRIERINLDGSEREIVYQGSSSELPFGLLIDQVNSQLLWTDYGTDQVMAAKLDGSGATPVIVSGLSDPVALLLVQEDGQRPGDRAERLVTQVEPSIAVYPNPATNTLQVSSLVRSQNIEAIRIMDWTGKTVFIAPANDPTLLVDISLFAPGQYMYSVTVTGKQLGGLFSIVR